MLIVLNDKLISMFPKKENFLKFLTPNGLPPCKLVLKRICPIILLRNLDLSNRLCNGTKMLCREFKNNVIDVEILKIKVINFPIRFCFAMTINKAQGHLITNVDVYLPHSVFFHDKLYVFSPNDKL
ncbi:hypothetical protein Pfo_024513 [Paulownia fortunei]|nr:hypothetical protein Pfo_024513 [Paulownia fortunei]